VPDPEPFSCPVTIEEPGRVFVVTPIGRIGPEEAKVFQGVVDDAYQAGGRRFVFDLGRLTYIGSIGLRVLASVASRVKADGVVCLGDPTPNVQSVLDVTKLAQLLHVFPTRAEAIDAARSR
jgi:anti-anti-sigma factor